MPGYCKFEEIPEGYKLIFRRSKTDPKTGRKIYSRRPMPMLVPIK